MLQPPNAVSLAFEIRLNRKTQSVCRGDSKAVIRAVAWRGVRPPSAVFSEPYNVVFKFRSKEVPCHLPGLTGKSH